MIVVTSTRCLLQMYIDPDIGFGPSKRNDRPKINQVGCDAGWLPASCEAYNCCEPRRHWLTCKDCYLYFRDNG
jgi:hypothetical protein